MGANDNILILGDFNLRNVYWERSARGFYFPSSRSSIGQSSSCLLDGYCTASLGQMNIVPNRDNRMLDLCFISEEICTDCTVMLAPSPLVKSCRFHPPLAVSLKLRVRCEFNGSIENIFYDFSKADFNGLNDFLSNINWEEALGDYNANLAASTVSAILLYAIDQFVPKRTNREPPKPAWSNSELRSLKKRKRAALRKHTKHRTDLTKRRYSKANSDYKRLNNQLFLAHQSQLQRRLKSNPKSFWQYVNAQRKETGLPSSMTYGNAEADSTGDIAELFRLQFSSVFVDEQISAHDVALAVSNIPDSTPSGGPFTVNEDMVVSAGRQLKNSTNPGPDGIPSVVLKRCLNALSIPLAIVFNLSLTAGEFPVCWKESFVFPIHKKGCKRNVSNYRGIASLSAASKLFELIILDKLVHNFGHCISTDQHGFMPKRSTTTNLVTTLFKNFEC